MIAEAVRPKDCTAPWQTSPKIGGRRRVLGRADVMDSALPGTIGGTYGGNPVACAAAIANIESMEELDTNGLGVRIGATIRARFERLAERSTLVGDVRGLGAMIGLELCYDRDPDRPARNVAQAVTAACLAKGVLLLPAGPYGNVLRVLSPLTISDADLDRGLTAIEEAVIESSERE